MTGFALNLDLTLYFDDLRRYSSVFVDLSKCKVVGDVENHIKGVFNLEDKICLTNKKFLIPRCENIQILQQYETLKVQKCDFFDQQIHKNKLFATTCDQTALNLIQSERTIDLSCRPKQRLKINICPSRFVSGATVAPFTTIEEIQSTPSTSSSYESVGVVSQSKEKQKCKRKRHEIGKDHEVLNGGDAESDDNILDMSFKKIKRKDYENCFSPHNIIEKSTKSSSRFFEQNGHNVDMEVDKSPGESTKKLKTTKKQPHLTDEDLDSSCWDTLISDNGNTNALTGYVKRHKKKSKKKYKTENNSTMTDLTVAGEYDDIEDISSSAVCEDNSVKKKHKKSKRCDEFESSLHQQNDVKIFKYTRKENDSTDVNSSSPREVRENKENKNCISKTNFEEYKKYVLEQTDKYIEKISVCNPEISCHTNDKTEDSQSVMETSVTFKSPENCKAKKICTNIENPSESSICNGLKTLEAGQKVQTYSEFLDEHLKKKRVRKHNKKKKRENLAYLSAVGPVLNSITTKPEEFVPSARTSKHVFFDNEDISEEMKIPPTPAGILIPDVKGPPVAENQNPANDMHTQKVDSAESATWQREILKLASASKPVVFRRSTPATSDLKTDLPVQSSHTVPSQHNSPTVLPEKNPAKDASSDACNSMISRVLKDVLEDYKKSNGGISDGSNSEVVTNTETASADGKGKVPDSGWPIPTDVQNIILTNYPIIDKVVAEDLILFKILKLNDNNQPGLSKTILAKVNNCTSFPDKISLQIMEGCEECQACMKDAGSTELMVELHWTDILEPRLFYP